MWLCLLEVDWGYRIVPHKLRLWSWQVLYCTVLVLLTLEFASPHCRSWGKNIPSLSPSPSFLNMNDSLFSKVKVLLRYTTGSQNIDNLFPIIIRFRFSFELVGQIMSSCAVLPMIQ